MINKINVIKNFKKKINELKKHNKLYFNNDNPVIIGGNKKGKKIIN